MSRFKIVCAAAILLALRIVGVTWFTNAAIATSIKPPAPPPSHHPFQISQTYVAGSLAIHPHLAKNGSGAAFLPTRAAFSNGESSLITPCLLATNMLYSQRGHPALHRQYHL